MGDNFHVIKNKSSLPTNGDTPISAISLQVDNEQDAFRYAQRFPERQIYWLTDFQIAIWYQLLRRTGDLHRVTV